MPRRAGLGGGQGVTNIDNVSHAIGGQYSRCSCYTASTAIPEVIDTCLPRSRIASVGIPLWTCNSCGIGVWGKGVRRIAISYSSATSLCVTTTPAMPSSRAVAVSPWIAWIVKWWPWVGGCWCTACHRITKPTATPRRKQWTTCQKNSY